MIKSIHIIGLLLSVAILGCFDEFNDPTQSIVKKTEIIAITLNPPEAMPGDMVEATVHVVDQMGRNRAANTLWMLDTPTEIFSLMSQTVVFEVPQLPDEMYTDDGVAPLQISVAVAKDGRLDAEQIALNAQHYIDSGEVLFGMRTLTVTRTPPRNNNPHVTSVAFGDENSPDNPVAFALSTSINFHTQRQIAMENPVEVHEDSEIHFAVQAAPALAVNGLTYQWISTAGDFKARRSALEPWISPEFNIDSPTIDPTAPGADVRQDRNLIPIWLIVRDDGEAHHLGATLVEFYVRVLPKIDK